MGIGDRYFANQKNLKGETQESLQKNWSQRSVRFIFVGGLKTLANIF